MKYSIKAIEGGNKIAFEVTNEEWQGFLERSYQKNKGKINVQGFRKGHAPRHLIEKLYGKGVFFDDAFNFCFSDSFSRALDEHPEIYPVEEPHIDLDDAPGDGIKFSASFAIKPEPVLGEYKGLEIEKAEYPVGGKDVDAELDKAREKLSRKIEKETEALSGDIVNIDYSGSIEGAKFDGGSAKGHELVLGSNTFIPGFEQQIVGMKKGEVKDITVKFPDDYPAPQLSGKDAVFNIIVNHIYTKELPELNDEFAKETSQFDTLKEYKDDILKGLKETAEGRAKAENENALIGKIVESSQVKIPDSMVQSELDYMLQDFSYRLMYMYNGMKLEDYFKYTNSSKEDFKKERKDEALRNVKTRLCLDKIIREEKLEVTDEDLENEYVLEAEKSKKTVEEFKESLDQSRIPYIKNGILSKKLMDFLLKNNNFVSKKAGKKA